MKKLVFLSCVSCVALTSIASAETIFIPGVAGIRDQANVSCSDPTVPTGEMEVLDLGSACLIAYPINIPAGKTFDSIEIAYDGPTPNPNNSITAYLAQNRVKPKLGAIAIAGASANPPPFSQQGFLHMQPLNIPVATGSVYWVQIFDEGVSVINYVAVAYH